MKERTVFIQNIISPYRNQFFNMLAKQATDFSVYYMGETEPDRGWDTSQLKRSYPNWVDNKGHYVTIGGYHAHFNPRLVWKVLHNKDVKNIVLAVSWQDPNIMTIAFAKRLHLTNKRLFFWAEANYKAEWSKRHNSKFKWWLKRMVFNAVDGALIIPGRMAELTFEIWGIKPANFIFLPNTIDDSALQYKAGQRAQNSMPVFVMPIRIIERIKGGLIFFNAIGEENIRKAKFIIAGDGEDKDKYIQFVKEHHFEDNIEFAGFCDSSKMMELYNQANAIILPSFSDPSPLSLVEALYFHLPILCSNHCGNHYETVEEGSNGYTFSPLEKDEIKAQYELFMSQKGDWAEMGERSAQLYEERFNTHKVIMRFLDQYERVKK